MNEPFSNVSYEWRVNQASLMPIKQIGKSQVKEANYSSTTLHASTTPPSTPQAEEQKLCKPIITKLVAQPKSTSNKLVKVTKKKKSLKPAPKLIQYQGNDMAVGRQLGTGGFSHCHMVTTASGKVFAAKFITKDRTVNYRREVEIHRDLEHANIVRFRYLAQTEDHVVLVLDYCPNLTLLDMVTKYGRLTEYTAREMMSDIIQAVVYLHSKLIHHGDLKLSNILLDAQMRPKVADFGFAKKLESPTAQRTSFCGTVSFMAPEVLRKPCIFGFPADIWALGAILYNLVYGFTPFDASEAKKVISRIKAHDLKFPPLRPSLSLECLGTISLMLDRDPESRPLAQDLCCSPLTIGPNESSTLADPPPAPQIAVSRTTRLKWRLRSWSESLRRRIIKVQRWPKRFRK